MKKRNTASRSAESFTDSDTLLVYSITPDSVYYTRDSLNPSIAKLTISATNNSGGEITINSFEVELIISGDPAQVLTEVPGQIIAATLQPDTWKFKAIDPGVFEAKPLPGVTIPDKTTIQFELQNIVVNETQGTTFVTIYELSASGEGIKTFNIAKIRSDLKIDEFRADPPEVAPGATTTLRWVTTAAASVTLLPGDHPGLPTSGSTPVTVNDTTTFTLTAYGTGPSVSDQVTVSVAPVRITSFEATPSQVNANDKVTLTWTTENADKCSINPGFPNLATSGSVDVYPSADTTYTLTAISLSGKTENLSRSVTINPVQITDFTAVPDYGVVLGTPVTLAWNTASSTSVSISPNIGQVQPNAQKLVIPGAKTTYTLSAQGKGGPVTKDVTVIPMMESWQIPTTTAIWNDFGKPVLLMMNTRLWMMAYGNSQLVSYSDDGSYWEPAGVATWSSRSSAGGAALGGKLWLMGGTDYKTKQPLNDVWSSPDGATWTKVTANAQWSARSNFGCIAYGGKLWVIGGTDASGTYLNDVWNSVDGITWTQVRATSPWVARSSFGLVEFNGAMYIICGKTGTSTATNDLWYSTDGNYWTPVPISSKISARSNPNTCTIGDRLFVAGGTRATGEPIGDLLYMSTTFEWTLGKGIIQSPAPQDCGSVQYQNALWIVGGFTGPTIRINRSVYYYFPADQ